MVKSKEKTTYKPHLEQQKPGAHGGLHKSMLVLFVRLGSVVQ